MNKANPNRKSLGNAGGKPKLATIEDALHAWVQTQRADHLIVTRGDIQIEALRRVDESDLPVSLKEGKHLLTSCLCLDGNQLRCAAFVASKGWLERFMKRKKLSLRAITGNASAQDLNEINRRCNLFLREILRRRKERNYKPWLMVNMVRDCFVNSLLNCPSRRMNWAFGSTQCHLGLLTTPAPRRSKSKQRLAPKRASLLV